MRKFDVTDAFVERYLSGLCLTGRHVPKRMYRRFMKGELIAPPELNPNGYTCPIDFSVDYQSVRLLKKFCDGSGADAAKRRQLALDKFFQCEDVCASVNQVLVNRCKTLSQTDYQRLDLARQKIYNVLGPFSWDLALPYCDFGPGASIGVPRKQSHVAHKIGAKNPTVTGECLALAQAFIKWAPLISGINQEFKIVPGSKVVTVPKDARIDRVIAIEPLWNMFFQKGIGGLIRHRLRRYGLDLNVQADFNRSLACSGSIYGHLATLDLSSASDTISLELCRFLLPPDWFDAMMVCRSKTCHVDGRDIILKKMSSMGNGFTFELETLIFLALCEACSPARLSVNIDLAVFGDDIIVPPEIAGELTAVLDKCGFTVNPSKSFVTGPFRESCGGHYFDGYDVTPFHLRKKITSINEIYWAANQTRLYASRLGADLYCSSLVREAHDFLVKSLAPRLRRNLIPRGSGDDGLIAPFDEACPRMATTPWGTKCFSVPCFGPVAVDKKHDDIGGLLVKLYSADHRAIKEGDALARVTLEPVSRRFRQKRRWWHQQWPWLGSWA